MESSMYDEMKIKMKSKLYTVRWLGVPNLSTPPRWRSRNLGWLAQFLLPHHHPSWRRHHFSISSTPWAPRRHGAHQPPPRRRSTACPTPRSPRPISWAAWPTGPARAKSVKDAVDAHSTTSATATRSTGLVLAAFRLPLPLRAPTRRAPSRLSTARRHRRAAVVSVDGVAPLRVAVVARAVVSTSAADVARSSV
jgi:hypothetical protein